jgi:ABC-type branched-subunit amino acid transport system ATPase component
VQTICGLLPTQAGKIWKSGREIQSVPAHLRSSHGVAVVLEGRRLFGELSVATNLALAEATGSSRPQKFTRAAVLDLFPYMKGRLDAPVSVLSGGEQQMVAIARALLLQPDLLILDEPSTGLAPKVVKEIVAVVAGLREHGMSLILVEQNAAVAAEMTDRAYVMSLGRVVHEMKAGEWGDPAHSEALVGAYLGH